MFRDPMVAASAIRGSAFKPGADNQFALQWSAESIDEREKSTPDRNHNFLNYSTTIGFQT
jgi:hypothetical protein